MSNEILPSRRGLGRAKSVALIATALPVIGSIGTLAAGPWLAAWLRDLGAWGIFIFVLSFAVMGVFALAPTYTTSIIAGWTFGFAVGFPAVLIALVGGSTMGYIAARRVATERVHAVLQDHPKWETIRRALVEEKTLKTMWIVFLMRLSPVLPFGTTNVLLATTGVAMPVYVFGTLLGLMPRMGLIAFAAAKAERLDFENAESWWVLGLGLLATGICISVLAMIGKQALARGASASLQTASA